MQTRLTTEERQAEIVAAALKLAHEISPVSITTSDIATAIGITPVSYTHLDVYKRQRTDSATQCPQGKVTCHRPDRRYP